MMKFSPKQREALNLVADGRFVPGLVREDDGTIRRVYEDRKQGDTFVILDPRLRLENLAEVQQQVVALLSGTKTLGEVSGEEEAAAAETPADEAQPETT